MSYRDPEEKNIKNTFAPSLDKLKMIENINEKFVQEQKEIIDTKYQNITYYKQNGSEVMGHDKWISIDFLKAMSEMEKLDWEKPNHIGFKNHRTEETVQFIRKGKNNWYADIPIKNNGEWKGYCWGAYSDNKTISNMMRLFFEEVEWFGMLEWKMRRVSQNGRY